jgi:hypothetical protein
MTVSSESLEAFSDRVKAADTELSKMGNRELTAGEAISTLAGLAKEWLRLSPELKNSAEGLLPSLDAYDLAMSELLQATKIRTRATSYRKKLLPFVDSFLDKVVVAYMRYEGSPSQAAARQVEGVFQGAVTAEELAYVQEAARCSSQHCHRAAIIMLWAAAVSRVHNAVQSVGFTSFNSAAGTASSKKGAPYSRLTKGLTVGSLAELQRLGDKDVLIVGLELWKYDLQVFEEQDRLLGIRNSAAHPGMYSPLALDVRLFADKVRRNVFDVVR